MRKQSRLNFKRQCADHNSAQITVRRQYEAERFLLSAFVAGAVILLLLSGCATPSAKLPPPPPKYVDHIEDTSIPSSSRNSLWSENANLFEDRKARRLNDLVTINIVESFSGSGKADTDTSKESSVDLAITKLLGMNTDFNLQNSFLLKDLYKGGNVFLPEVEATTKSDFKGKGDTSRAGTLSATITAKVVEVMPNGNLVLEARKELTINNEKQILVLTGMARPDDISADNVIMSSSIADAQVLNCLG